MTDSYSGGGGEGGVIHGSECGMAKYPATTPHCGYVDRVAVVVQASKRVNKRSQFPLGRTIALSKTKGPWLAGQPIHTANILNFYP